MITDKATKRGRKPTADPRIQVWININKSYINTVSNTGDNREDARLFGLKLAANIERIIKILA